jgi:hypothetical protein
MVLGGADAIRFVLEQGFDTEAKDRQVRLERLASQSPLSIVSDAAMHCAGQHSPDVGRGKRRHGGGGTFDCCPSQHRSQKCTSTLFLALGDFFVSLLYK